MRGKAGLVIGLAAGYVLGARAGRERYRQIAELSGKVWRLPVVQTRVRRVKDLGASAALAVPRAVWTVGVRVVRGSSSDAHTGADAAATAPRDDSGEG